MNSYSNYPLNQQIINSNNPIITYLSKEDQDRFMQYGGKIKYVKEEVITFKDPNRENMIVQSTSCKTYGKVITFFKYGFPVLRLNADDIYSIYLQNAYPYVC